MLSHRGKSCWPRRSRSATSSLVSPPLSKPPRLLRLPTVTKQSADDPFPFSIFNETLYPFFNLSNPSTTRVRSRSQAPQLFGSTPLVQFFSIPSLSLLLCNRSISSSSSLCERSARGDSRGSPSFATGCLPLRLSKNTLRNPLLPCLSLAHRLPSSAVTRRTCSELAA